MWINAQKPGRQLLLFLMMLAMLVNLFTTRALLSVSMILFVMVACFHPNIIKQLKFFLQSPLLLGISFLFLLPFISGLWSRNTEQWKAFVEVKLPLLFLPIAFAGRWQLNRGQWQAIAFVFLLLVIIGSGWSVAHYFGDMQAVHQEYLKAKVIPTPLENDHVRFSWMVCVAIITGCVLFGQIKLIYAKIALAIALCWLTIYLHILSARTGLMGFYLFLFIAIIALLLKQRKRQYIVYAALLFLLLPFMSWLALPTFQNRIHYFVYDLSYIKSNTYLPGANDGNRVLSLKAGWSILQQHPFGIGAGDVPAQTMDWYGEHIPNMHPSDKLLLPASEWLVYGAGEGWPGFVLFTIIMFAPLFIKHMRYRFLWIAINGTAAFSLLFDIGLEVQFGVFLYAFIILWCWKWFTLKCASSNE